MRVFLERLIDIHILKKLKYQITLTSHKIYFIISKIINTN